MPFPKFTSGRSGRLTFDTLNELFARVESLEQSQERNPWSISAPRDAFFAKVTAQNISPNLDQYQFAEVCRDPAVQTSPLDPAAWTAVTGGRTSAGINSNGTLSSFTYPLVGTGLSVGSVYPAIATVTTGGDLIYVPVAAPSGSSFPARIVSSAVQVAGMKWIYQVKKVAVTSGGAGFTDLQTNTSPALNGCESIADSPPIYGVGMQPPVSGTIQLVRQPIRNNIVAIVSDDGAGKLVFSIPNGYKVTC